MPAVIPNTSQQAMNAYSTLSTSSAGSVRLNNILTAYNAMAEFELWAEPVFQMIATKKGEHLTQRGEKVQFFFWNDLTPTKTALDQLKDVSPVTGTDIVLTVPMAEYGSAVQLTALVHAQSLWSIQADLGMLLGRQMRDSLELIMLDTILNSRQRYRNGLNVPQLASSVTDATIQADSGVFGTSRGQSVARDVRQGDLGVNFTAGVGTSNDATWDDAWQYAASVKDTGTNKAIYDATLNLHTLRRMSTDMKNDSVKPLRSGSYLMYLHPDVCMDLLEEGGDGALSAAMIGFQVHNRPGAYEAGALTPFSGITFVESPRVPIVTGNAGAGTGAPTANQRPDVYLCPMFGADGVAKAFSTAPNFGESPRMMIAPVTDALRRFNALGWYTLHGYQLYRGEALRIAEVKSSNATNV